MALISDDRFTTVFRDHYHRIVGLALRIVGEQGEAEDAAQEAFLALRTDPVGLREEADIAAWLSRVVINGSLNRLRTHRRSAVREQVFATRELAVVDNDPVEVAVARDDRDQVRATLAVLPDRQAAALLLRHSGYRYREIASVLEIAEGSVGVLLARGEQAFRRAHEELTG